LTEAARLGPNVAVIDADRPIEAIHAEALAAVERALAR
jgi:thymidylate kinase